MFHSPKSVVARTEGLFLCPDGDKPKAMGHPTQDHVQTRALAATTQYDFVSLTEELFHNIALQLAEPTSMYARIIRSHHYGAA